MGTIHVQTFVGISGYLFYMNRFEKNKYTNFRTDVLHRSRRLIVPYFFALSWVVPFNIWITGNGLKEIIRDFLFGISPNQLWFLLMLFWILLFFYGFSSCINRVNPIVAMVAAIMIRYSVQLIKIYLPIGAYQFSRGMQYLPFFLLGFYVRKYVKGKPSRTLVVAFFIVNIVLFGLYKRLAEPEWILPFVSISGMCFVYAVTIKMSGRLLRFFSTANRICENGMGIYLVHQQIIYVLLRIIEPRIINPVAVTLITFVLTIIVSDTITTQIRKTHVGRILIGG